MALELGLSLHLDPARGGPGPDAAPPSTTTTSTATTRCGRVGQAGPDDEERATAATAGGGGVVSPGPGAGGHDAAAGGGAAGRAGADRPLPLRAAPLLTPDSRVGENTAYKPGLFSDSEVTSWQLDKMCACSKQGK